MKDFYDAEFMCDVILQMQFIPKHDFLNLRTAMNNRPQPEVDRLGAILWEDPTSMFYPTYKF